MTKPTDDNTLSSDLAAAGMAYRMVIIDRDRLRQWLVAQSSADCRALLERLDKGEFDGEVAMKQPAPALRDLLCESFITCNSQPGESFVMIKTGR